MLRARSRTRSLVLTTCLFAVVVLVLLASGERSSLAQTLLLTLETSNPDAGARFGFRVAVGDVNGDENADIAVGAPHEDVGDNAAQGRVYVFSGVDGSQFPFSPLNTPNPQAAGFFGDGLAVGDVNDDGKADIAVGAHGEQRVYVFSGVDGSQFPFSPLNSLNPEGGAGFGYAVAVGDVNGDGKGDIAAAAPWEDVADNQDQGRVYVFSGVDGAPLFGSPLDIPNPQVGANFGISVAVGDVNDDGKGDIAVGAYFADVGGNDRQGRVYVFSGVDGSELPLSPLDTPNPMERAYLGISVAVGDVNGDGTGDITAGAYGEEVDGDSYQGRAYVFSGTDGSPLLTLDVPNPQAGAAFGNSVAVGDVNGDGITDIGVGAFMEDVAGNADQGRAYVFSGDDGSLVFALDTPNPQANVRFGWPVAVGDVNADGRGDVAVGAWWEDVGSNTDQGRAYVFMDLQGAAAAVIEFSELKPPPGTVIREDLVPFSVLSVRGVLRAWENAGERAVRLRLIQRIERHLLGWDLAPIDHGAVICSRGSEIDWGSVRMFINGQDVTQFALISHFPVVSPEWDSCGSALVRKYWLEANVNVEVTAQTLDGTAAGTQWSFSVDTRWLWPTIVGGVKEVLSLPLKLLVGVLEGLFLPTEVY